MRGRNIRDIEAFHDARRVRQAQRIGELLHVCHWVDCARQTAANEPPRRLRGVAQIFDHVAQFSGFFEIHFLGSLSHLFLQCGDHLSRFAFEELDRLRHAFAVLLGTNFAQAHRHLIGRGFQFALRWRTAPKGEHAEFLAHEIERLPQRTRMWIRPKITRTVVFLEPRQAETRPFFR